MTWKVVAPRVVGRQLESSSAWLKYHWCRPVKLPSPAAAMSVQTRSPTGCWQIVNRVGDTTMPS